MQVESVKLYARNRMPNVVESKPDQNQKMGAGVISGIVLGATAVILIFVVVIMKIVLYVSNHKHGVAQGCNFYLFLIFCLGSSKEKQGSKTDEVQLQRWNHICRDQQFSRFNTINRGTQVF